MIKDIKLQVPVNAAALNKINLLGVTNSWAFHRQGSAIGFGIITIWELGMICGHSRDFPPTPIVRASTKLGVLPRPKIVYGKFKEKCALCGS